MIQRWLPEPFLSRNRGGVVRCMCVYTDTAAAAAVPRQYRHHSIHCGIIGPLCPLRHGLCPRSTVMSFHQSGGCRGCGNAGTFAGPSSFSFSSAFLRPECDFSRELSKAARRRCHPSFSPCWRRCHWTAPPAPSGLRNAPCAAPAVVQAFIKRVLRTIDMATVVWVSLCLPQATRCPGLSSQG